MALNLGDIKTRLRMSDESGPGLASFSKNIDHIGRRAVSVSTSFAKIGATVGTVVGAGSLSVLTKEGLSSADALGKASDKLGIYVQDLQAMRRASEFAAIDTKTLEKSMQKMAQRTAEAADRGVGPAADALNRLGIDANELNRINPAQQIEKVLGELSKLENHNDKLYIADALFGAKGVDLLRLAPGAIADAREEIDKYGLALDRVDVARIEAANDAMARLSLQSQGVGQQIGVGLAPAIEATAIAILEASGAASDWAELGSDAGEIWLTGLVKIVDIYNVIRVAGRDTYGYLIQGSIAVSEQALKLNAFLGEDTKVQQRAILVAKMELAELRRDTAQIQIDGSYEKTMNAIIERVRVNAENTAKKIKAAKAKQSSYELPPLDDDGKAAKAIESQLQRLINAQLTPYEQAAEKFGDSQATIAEALKTTIGITFDESELRARTYGELIGSITKSVTGKLDLKNAKNDEQLGAAESQAMLQLALATDQANLNRRQQLDITRQVTEAIDLQRVAVENLTTAEEEKAAKKLQEDTLGAFGADSTTLAIAQEQAKQEAVLETIAIGWQGRVQLDADYFTLIEEQSASHQARMIGLFEQGGKKLVDFEKLSSASKKKVVIGDLRQMTAAISTENRAAFEIQKIFAATDAAQNAMSATMRAYRWGANWGPWAAAAAAAPAAIFGAAQVSSILKQSFGDTSTSDAPAASGTAANDSGSSDTANNLQSQQQGTGNVTQNHFHIAALTEEQAAAGVMLAQQTARDLALDQGSDVDLVLSPPGGSFSAVA